jgi:carbamoyltransferase
VNILGISAYYHDSAAALLQDGRLVAAAQEERFSRRKHDARFPRLAAEYCLRTGGIAASALDHVVFYDKPLLKFDRILETYLATAPFGIRSFLQAIPLWLKEKLWVPDTIRKELGWDGDVLFARHHDSHAASAFFPSPFEEAAVLTMDGVGEWATTTVGVGRGADLQLLQEIRFPHSLGLLYSAFTYHAGFKVNSGEYKLMGLAPYGEPRYVDLILRELVDLKEDGSLRLNLEYFNYLSGLTMTGRRFDRLFGGPPRRPEAPLTAREMDMARSIQAVTELAMLRMAAHAHRLTGMKRLCLAGGVALNCVGNGRVLREGPFEELWIQPAAGDAGGALGAALLVHHRLLGNPRTPAAGDAMAGSYLGPEFGDEDVRRFLDAAGARYRTLEWDEVPRVAAGVLAEGKVVGWFQGRMEFGPRALGNRSILGDPRDREMQSRMNLKIKFRESFRPFAPAVPRDRVADWFELDAPSPYMLLVAPVGQARRLAEPGGNGATGIARLKLPRSTVPAITHVDWSARVQTVHPETNPLFHGVLRAFEERTGCPVLVNTSFNVRGEPIVGTPEDAFRCFRRTQMDCLFLGRHLLDARDFPAPEPEEDWRGEIEPD